MEVFSLIFLLIVASIISVSLKIPKTEASSIIYINEDGSIFPQTANITSLDNVTYTFTGDNEGSIDILRANIVIDGNQCTLLGIGPTNGILIEKENVTVRQVTIQGFTSGSGVWVPAKSNITISENNITECSYGIYLYNCSEVAVLYNTVTQNEGAGIFAYCTSSSCIVGNNATSNLGCAIRLDYSIGNTLTDNVMNSNSLAFGVLGDKTSDFLNCIDDSNTIDGKPIYYWINEHDRTVPTNASYACLVNCTRIMVEGLSLAKNRYGMVLVSTTNSTVVNNNITANERGILTLESSSVVFTENNVSDNGWFGVRLVNSSENGLFSNTVARNRNNGIVLESSSNNTLYGNNVTSTVNHGIFLVYSSNTTISGNDAKNSTRTGIYISGGSGSNVSWNKASLNWDDGITFVNAANSTIFGNSITENTKAGTRMQNSTNCSILENQVTQNKQGILVDASLGNNYIGRNIITANYDSGLLLRDSLTISVFDNILTGNPCGIHVLRSFSNNIYRNTIKANGDSGITLNESSTNSISENNITQNPTGTRVAKSLGNQIYHNSYVANAQDVNITVSGYPNFWDDGYPSGGNYWSKHPITDSYRGTHQNETGCDGICDCNCTLDVDNADRYPLHKPYAGPHDLGIEDPLSSKTLIPQNPHSGCPKNCTCTWWTNVTTSLVLVNYGIQEENFQFFFYINGTIQTIFSETLEARTSTTLTSVLNTTNWSKGTYVLQTFVLGDLGETDLTDNYCELKIYVLVPGDVRFPIPIVDMTDLYYLALNYAKTAPYLTPLEANLDINSDGIINMLDLYIAALHFGQK